MPTRSLSERAAAGGVSTEAMAEVLLPHARAHFGPDVAMEFMLDGAGELQLFAALKLATETGPHTVALEAARQLFGDQLELNEELLFQVFFTPEQAPLALAQDEQYLALTGVSGLGCGFWPVARQALEALLGVEAPLRPLQHRAFACAVETHPGFVLRRTTSGQLLLKEPVVVAPGGEVPPHAGGRRDLVAGTVVEVTRREVPPDVVARGVRLQATLEAACETAPHLLAELRASLPRQRAALLELVPTEAEGRFLTGGLLPGGAHE